MAQDRHPAENRMIDAIVATATPPGRSALGIVRVAGPGTRDVARVILGEQPFQHRQATVRLATHGNHPIDQVVALYWEAPETPIGEDLLEITTHGSPEILAAIVDAAVSAGARPAEPGEFTRRAFTNGKIDLTQAEAVETLIQARGHRARRAAVDRLNGEFSRIVREARTPVLDLLCLLEARLDHPDEDIPPLTDSEIFSALDGLLSPLDRLIAAHDRGRIERDGIRVCLAGKPNAGKSSLLNALLGRDRAIVAPTPGTTRDTLEEHATFEGLPVLLVDTAGMRANALDPTEQEGIRRAQQALAGCDVAVLVIDASQWVGGTLPAEELAHRVRIDQPVVVAFNKSDLIADRAPLTGGIAISAKTGEGLGALSLAVARAAGCSDMDQGESLLIGARDRKALSVAKAEISAARSDVLAHPGRWEDRVAGRLRDAHASLGAILGEGAPDEVLHAIFSRFCVGK